MRAPTLCAAHRTQVLREAGLDDIDDRALRELGVLPRRGLAVELSNVTFSHKQIQETQHEDHDVLGRRSSASRCLDAAGGRRQAATPRKPIRIIVPYQAGQGTDVAARYLARAPRPRRWGKPSWSKTGAGAGGNIGASEAARAPPDGYTLVMGTNGTHVLNQFLYASMPFDPEKDFEPIGAGQHLSDGGAGQPVGALQRAWPTCWPMPRPGRTRSTSACRARRRGWCSNCSSSKASPACATFPTRARAPP